MVKKTVLVAAICGSLWACGPSTSERTAPGSGKADGPFAVIAVVDTDQALTPLLQLTNQTAETAWADTCRNTWWERKVTAEPVAIESETGEEEPAVGRPLVRWVPAGPAKLGCDGDNSWEHLPAGERTAIAISLPIANWTPGTDDEAPAPGTYRLAAAVLDGLGDEAKMLGIARSDELVLGDVSGECQALCDKVKTCQTGAGATFEATECTTWCKNLLSPTRPATVTNCGACYTQQTCGDLLPEPEHPYQISSGNPGACMVECRLATCETASDCGAAQACEYYNKPVAGYYGGGGGHGGGYGDYGTWAQGFACADLP